MSLRATSAGVAAVLAAAFALSVQLRAQPAPPHSQDATENAPADAPSSNEAGSQDDPLPIPPVPPRIAEGAQYETCLDRLATDPSGADTIAAALAASSTQGSAEAAAHCHALAQVELGNTEEGATLLDRLAAVSTAPAASRAIVFAQATQAWSMAGHADHAFASASQALTLSPDDPELRIGHAIAALALQKYAEAADDLTRALDLDPRRADALVLRATAHRRLDQLDQARADIDAAFTLDPDNPDGLLERGIIRQRLGDPAGAARDWQRALDLAADTQTGDLAQQNLELLAAGPRQ